MTSLCHPQITIVRHKLKLGRGHSKAVILLKALDGHSNNGEGFSSNERAVFMLEKLAEHSLPHPMCFFAHRSRR